MPKVVFYKQGVLEKMLLPCGTSKSASLSHSPRLPTMIVFHLLQCFNCKTTTVCGKFLKVMIWPHFFFVFVCLFWFCGFLFVLKL